MVGRIEINDLISEKDIDRSFEGIFKSQSGGHWKPNHCVSLHKVAIIVPYRDRSTHLRLFLNHMHKFLQKQQLDYAIYIVEEVLFLLSYFFI